MCEVLNKMSENKDLWNTNKRNELKTAANAENSVDDDFYKVRIRSGSEVEKLPVYKIKHNILGYNFNNVRIIAEKMYYEQKEKIRLDPMNDTHQEVIGDILYNSKFYSSTATEDLEKDIIEKGLEDPLIVSIDGTVWNGNRRLSICRKLYKDTGDQTYERVNIVVLPELSHKDLTRLERRLQMSKELKQKYGPIQTRLDVRMSMNDKDWEINEILDSYGNKYDKVELIKFVQEIDLIDDYLERINRPKEYVFIETSGNDGTKGPGVESFITLNQTLQKQKKRNETKIEIEKVKMSGFQIIHHPDSTYHNVRNYDAVISTNVARDEFKNNSATFKNFNTITKDGGDDVFGNDYVKKEFDNLDTSYQTVVNAKKDAEKIATNALKLLEKINDYKIPRNDEFREILNSLEKQIRRLRSKSG